jgi:hypothetical protein
MLMNLTVRNCRILTARFSYVTKFTTLSLLSLQARGKITFTSNCYPICNIKYNTFIFYCNVSNNSEASVKCGGSYTSSTPTILRDYTIY